jgi:hypothetical protein
MARNRGPEYYADQYKRYHSSPKAIEERAQRNAARAKLEKEGVVHKGDGKDVHHKRDVSAGGSNARSNLTAVPVGVNRTHWQGKKR